jgi:hypothetical protein
LLNNLLNQFHFRLILIINQFSDKPVVGDEPPGGVWALLNGGIGPRIINGLLLAVVFVFCGGMLFEGETIDEDGADIEFECDCGAPNSWAPDVKLWDVVIADWFDANLLVCSTGVGALLVGPLDNTGIDNAPYFS